uniref:OSJNBa0052P16.21 protein n=1 Tax=Oryza sativa subsp. japonica TaxID=39947 RepID=Q7XX69_ORYSJ|nr:OSJNBa0052P16.21 [Oryza sativa Japonica Group]
MSTSASPSVAPSAKYAEHLSNLVTIPSLSHERHYFLGPIGDLDPTDFIIAKTNRIPVRLANPNLGHWKNTRSLGHLLRKPPLRKAVPHGPMTLTLIDNTMITGLDVTSSANPMSLNTKNQIDFKTKSIGGWSSYVAAYMGKGPITSREHVAFLLMWLEKFLFYGSSCAPTTNWQFVAEALESKRQFPLGKILLGYLYQMLNNASAKIAVGSVVGADNRIFPSTPKQQWQGHRICSRPLTKWWWTSSSSHRLPCPQDLKPTSRAYERTSRCWQEKEDQGQKAIDPSALALKKKAKKHKPKPADDLPTLDPSIEQALDEEEIEEDADKAAAELQKKIAVKKKSAATTLKPAPPVLVDLFSFDIKDYFDEETEDDTTNKALAPLTDDVKKILEDISRRLEASSLDSLVVDYGSIRTRLHKVQALIPDELVNAPTPAVYLEQYQFKLENAKLRLAEHRERKNIEATNPSQSAACS